MESMDVEALVPCYVSPYPFIPLILLPAVWGERYPERGEHGERAEGLLPGGQDREDPRAQVGEGRCEVWYEEFS